MKLNIINVLIGCVLCVVLIAVFGALNRTADSRDDWRPSDAYSHVGGSTYSTASYSTGSSSSVDGLSVPAASMRGGNSMLRRRVSFSHAPAYNHAYSVASSTERPISNGVASAMYTTSSATMKSFGGGSAASGVSMSGGAVRATNSQSPIANSQLSIANIQSPIAYTQLPATEVQSPIVANYQGIGNTTTGGPRAMRGRQNAGPGTNDDAWLNWLVNNGQGYGSYDEETGVWTLNKYDLYSAWEAYCASWSPIMGGSEPPTWDAWLSWFMGSEGNPYGYTDDGGDTYKYYQFVPLGDAFALLLLALCYVLFVFLKSRLVARHAE